MILAAAAKRLRQPGVLSEVVGLTRPKVEQLLSECVKAGWLTSTHRITQLGLRELAVARELGLAPTEEVELRTGFYYPRSLRTAKDSL
jgi:hypothetical protein